MRIIIALLLSIIPLMAVAQDRAATERQFRDWLQEVVWPEAEAEGISRATFDAAFAGVTLNWDLPGLQPPGSSPKAPKTQQQAEFRSPGRYFRESNLRDLASIGRGLKAKNAGVLDRIEAKTGVPGRVLVAIWGRESGFGRVPIPHDAFEVIGTLAFMGGRSPEWFRGELVAALKIAEAGHAPERAIKSSWAGALGQPQFMPSSYLTYAADGDGDGRADIWRSEADTLASIASFLAQHGWVAGRDWGFEVTLPEGVSCTLEGPDNGRRIVEWEELGITRVSGRPFPEHEQAEEAFLLLPAGRNGPVFLVTPNFYALKSYNRSDLYALFIGNTGDRIEWGAGAFRAGWQDVDQLYRSDIAAIQRALEAQGMDVGGADGLPGYKTRRSIGAWQESTGQRATCFPDQSVKAALGG